jgi:transcriptional regulator with XRE-family HTH domain
MIEIDGDIKQKLKDYTSKARKVKTTIHWWDLYKGHYIKLKPGIQKQIFQKAIKKAGGYFTWLEKKLKISRRTIAECWKSKRNPQISTLIKVATFINLPLSKIEKNVIQISKSRFKPNLPFKFRSPEGAEIRAAFLSDGHLPKYPKGSPQYLASEYFLHKRLIKLCKIIFGGFNVHTYFDGKTYVTKFPSGIGSALEIAGIPRGDKRTSKTLVPRDILTSPEEIQTAYLRRVFDDEGDVCFDKHGKRAVRLTRSIDITSRNLNFSLLKAEKWTTIRNKNIPLNMLLLGEQLLLCKLGIDARIYSEGVYKSRRNKITTKWRIQIGQQDSLRKFAEIINFNLFSKRKKLSAALNSYKIHEFPNGKGEEFVTEAFKDICEKKRCFFYKDLSKKFLEIGKSYDLSGYYLQLLLKKKLIKKLKLGQYVFVN